MHLTPLGPGWGWGSRIIEIIIQSIALVTVVPAVWFNRGLSWVLSKILP